MTVKYKVSDFAKDLNVSAKKVLMSWLPWAAPARRTALPWKKTS